MTRRIAHSKRGGWFEASDLKGACPLCNGFHEPCFFTSGSLYCVLQLCRNPHHKPPGLSAREIIDRRRRD